VPLSTSIVRRTPEPQTDLMLRSEATSPVRPLTVMMVIPSLEAGAADAGVAELVGILARAGHHPIVVSRGGRLEAEIAASGGEFISADVASKNPIVMMRNAFMLRRLARERHCDVIHAHSRAPAWSAYLAARLTGIAFVTSWYKGFRAQNTLKRLYNSVMARGDRVIAVSDQLAELVHQRYGTPWERIVVVPTSVDCLAFDPAAIDSARIDAVRRHWGVGPDTKVILVVGRMTRRKGHHLMVLAARRLKDLGLTDFMCVFAGEDQGGTRYAGELWDLVLASDTTDVVRLVGALDDLPAAYAASTVAVSAAIQAEGLQRAILEAQAMARPVVVSELGAGPDVVLSPPAVADDLMTGLRVAAGDDAALAAALIRLFTMPEPVRAQIGRRGRDWVLSHFNAATVSDTALRLYADIADRQKAC
jgi:glycosyltransferase involved in cell wall biosynthesis